MKSFFFLRLNDISNLNVFPLGNPWTWMVERMIVQWHSSGYWQGIWIMLSGSQKFWGKVYPRGRSARRSASWWLRGHEDQALLLWRKKQRRGSNFAASFHPALRDRGLAGAIKCRKETRATSVFKFHVLCLPAPLLPSTQSLHRLLILVRGSILGPHIAICPEYSMTFWFCRLPHLAALVSVAALGIFWSSLQHAGSLAGMQTQLQHLGSVSSQPKDRTWGPRIRSPES